MMKRVSGKFLARLACGGVLLLLASACGPSIDDAQWTEQVKLHDGRMVEVWRRARRHAFGFPEAHRGTMVDYEVEYTPRKAHWKGSPYFVPISFEIFGGTPHLVLYLLDKSLCASLKKRPTDYAAQILRWENGRWVEISQDEFPIQQALINLYVNFGGRSAEDDPKGLISWEYKAQQDGYYADRPETVQQWFERKRWVCGESGK